MSQDNRPTNLILLFDIDGTLTVPRKEIDDVMRTYMHDLRSKVRVGVVGGSDLPKQMEQIGRDVATAYDYAFPENGLVAFKNGEQIGSQSMKDFIGDENLKRFINFCLHYIADLDIPIKRGTFIEFRTGLINVSPIGRNCSQEEREAFLEYDNVHKVRQTMVDVLAKEFADLGLKFSIGGQISFDVFPVGWDKTYCLQFLEQDGFTDIHFFGDKTAEGGNDHEIFASPKTTGHTVTSPADTREQVDKLLEQVLSS